MCVGVFVGVGIFLCVGVFVGVFLCCVCMCVLCFCVLVCFFLFVRYCSFCLYFIYNFDKNCFQVY